jgi:predicted ATPase with chaperone activity
MALQQVVHSSSEYRVAAPLPRSPQRLEDTGLDFGFVVELLAKVLFLRGQLRLPELSAHIKLPAGILDQVLTSMRNERLCEMSRRGETEGAMLYTLTENGRARAQDFLARSQYSGPAPVSLNAYIEQVQKQSILHMKVDRERVGEVFSNVVIKEQLLDQFGAGMASGRAVFVYGPAGSGKTYIAERLIGLASGAVGIPYAIAVDNEVIQVFDAVIHHPIVHEKTGSSLVDLGNRDDQRWVICHRPAVIAGAELTLSMLDLQFDSKTRFYQAPPHVKANNGLFIVDDLGRQLVSPRDLMNRWIVPMDRRVDYLALHTGKKFLLPFDLILVFSSNLPPSELADPAFLRRIGYKIFVGPLDEPDYRKVFTDVCAALGIPFTEEQYRHLLEQYHARTNTPLLACLPRDILGQLRDFARFNGVKPELNAELIDWAWNNYFTRD